MGKKKSVIIDDSAVEVESKNKMQNTKKEAEKAVVVEPKAELSEEKVQADVKAVEKDETTSEKKVSSKAQKEGKKSKAATKKEAALANAKKSNRSEKYKKASEEAEKSKRYNVTEAVERTKKGSYSKFDGTVEIHMSTNNKNMRGLVSLPFASGKKLTVLAFGKDASESGADIVGDDEKISAIQKGKVDFDVVVTTADWMPKLAKIAAILGPRGLMPNPKSGTITTDLKKAVTDIQSGKVEYKTDRNAQTMHLSIGKVSQSSEEIVANVKTLVNSIGKTRIKKVVLAPTMGPGVKVDMNSL
jgi:large subunit ribosomal protein L1